jgi:uncharacterized protein (UPF0261 family)
MGAVAHYIAEHLNRGKGPRAVIVPKRGYSMMNRQGMPLYDDAANMGFLETLQKELSPEVGLIAGDYHINDPECAAATAELFLKLWAAGRPLSPRV